MEEGAERWAPSAIDRVFDRSAPAGAEPSELAELEGLQGLRDLCVSALREEPSAEAQLQARRVAQRVLKRTTREDLGRRGDLGVILEFIGDRLRDSVVLRVAVAALVVQVTVVPIVAWHLLTEPTRGGVRFVLEPDPEEGIFDEVPAEEEPLSVVGGSRWWELDSADAWLQADADFEGAGALLDQVRSSLGGVVAEPSTATGFALQRFTGLEGADSSAAVGEAAQGVDGWVPLIDVILDAERLLDQVQRGGTWAELGAALEQVGQTLDLARAAVDSAPPGPLAVLASRTLTRARALGLMAPDPDPELEIPSPDAWLLLIGEEVHRAAPGDGFVSAWRRVVREL
jgi:hypothetical protein